MGKIAAVLALVAVLAVGVQIAGAQASSGKTVNVAGNWNVTLTDSSPAHAAAVGADVKEQWVIEQDGTKLKVKVTAATGGADSAADGAMTGVSGDVMKVQATDGEFMVQATYVGDEMVGTFRNYKQKKEMIFRAKRVH